MSSNYVEPVFRDRDDDHENSKDILVHFGLTKYYNAVSDQTEKGVDYDRLAAVILDCRGEKRTTRAFASLCGFSESVFSRIINNKNAPNDGLSDVQLLQVFAHRDKQYYDQTQYNLEKTADIVMHLCLADGYRYDEDPFLNMRYYEIFKSIYRSIEEQPQKYGKLAGLRMYMFDWIPVADIRIDHDKLELEDSQHLYIPNKRWFGPPLSWPLKRPATKSDCVSFFKEQLQIVMNRVDLEPCKEIQPPFFEGSYTGHNYLAEFAFEMDTPLMTCYNDSDLMYYQKVRVLNLFKCVFARYGYRNKLSHQQLLKELFTSRTFISAMRELSYQWLYEHRYFCYNILFLDHDLCDTAKQMIKFYVPFPVNFVLIDPYFSLRHSDFKYRLPDDEGYKDIGFVVDKVRYTVDDYMGTTSDEDYIDREDEQDYYAELYGYDDDDDDDDML